MNDDEHFSTFKELFDDLENLGEWISFDAECVLFDNFLDAPLELLLNSEFAFEHDTTFFFFDEKFFFILAALEVKFPRMANGVLVENLDKSILFL
jgi:hypothetical protein